MALFKRKHLKKILEGTKTQTRRTHKRTWKIGHIYSIRDRWFGKPQAHIKILRRFKQRLGDISTEDVKKEGYGSLAEFQRVWEEIHGPGSWDPDLVVTCYEFKLLKNEA